MFCLERSSQRDARRPDIDTATVTAVATRAASEQELLTESFGGGRPPSTQLRRSPSGRISTTPPLWSRRGITSCIDAADGRSLDGCTPSST
jgi:hypothetical protein